VTDPEHLQRSVISALCNPADYASPAPDPSPLPELPPTGPLEPLLRAAVRRAFADSADLSLSGGLDSSLLLALAVKEGFSPVCWTVVKNDNVAASEPKEAAAFAASLGSGCYGINLDDAELPEYFADAVRASGVPIYNAAGVRWFLYHRRLARGGATKLVSGVGADEIFMGEPHKFGNLEFLRAREPECELARQWLEPSFARHGAFAPVQAAGPRHAQALRMATEFAGSTLPVRANAATAARMECRLPYLDLHVRGWAAAQRAETLIASGGKAPLRELATRLLPESITSRPKRPGMAGLQRAAVVHDSWVGTLRSLLAPHRLQPLYVLDARAVLKTIEAYARQPDEIQDRALLKLASLVVLSEQGAWPASP
jgi:asparagine synthetase B (glutamine-hydrolysing)